MRLPHLLILSLPLLGLLVPARAGRADVLELADGRLVEGVVVRDGDTYRVHSRFGTADIEAANVTAHTKALSIDEQVKQHLARLDPDDTANRALLAQWLLKIGRGDEARATAEAVLEVDPEDAVAHGVLGHVRHQGVWRTPDEAKRAEGLEKHGDRWYTPQEWANQGAEARAEAERLEQRALAAAFTGEVNRAVRLMMSPDEKLRLRGRERLLALAREYDDPKLLKLVEDVDAYVKEADQLAVAASGLGSGGTTGAYGSVMGEFRATLSRLKRPIQTFETSLASNLGSAPVKIQLPELEVINIRTTGVIPAVIR